MIQARGGRSGRSGSSKCPISKNNKVNNIKYNDVYYACSSYKMGYLWHNMIYCNTCFTYTLLYI